MLQQAPAKATSFIELGGKARQLKAFSFTRLKSDKCRKRATALTVQMAVQIMASAKIRSVNAILDSVAPIVDS